VSPEQRAFVRLTQAVERVAQAVEHQQRPAFERIPIPQEALRPSAIDRHPFNVTPNAAIQLQAQVSVYDLANGRRYLRMVLLDGYGSVLWQTDLQASTMDELRKDGFVF
jgi:hypothetical protein